MIYNISDNKKIAENKIGSKAKLLMIAKSNGLNVPDGIILSTDFFQPWIQQIKQLSLWHTLAHSFNKEKCNELKKTIETLQLTVQQEYQLYKYLTNYPKDSLFAVRSSFIEEDTEVSSYSGIFETYLAIPLEDIEKYIVKVFASNFAFRAMSYRKKNNIRLNDITVAIIIQKQMNATMSGIAFSINPENNYYDEVVINAGFGLGTTIVSGKISSDHYIVNKIDNQIKEKIIVNQTFEININSEGKLVEKKSDYLRLSSLNAQQIIEVYQLVCACEQLMGYYVDIEWAYENKKLFLLQIRPITAYFPIFPELLTEPKEQKKIYVDALITTQGFSQQMSVLGLDIWSLVMEKISREGIMPSGEDGYLLYLHGKQYFHVSNLIKGMGKNLGISTVGNHDTTLKDQKEHITKRYKASKRTKEMNRSLIAMLKTALNIVPVLVKAKLNISKTINAYNKLIDQSIEHIKTFEVTEDFNDLVQKELDLLDRIYLLSSINVLGELSFRKIKKIFKGYSVEETISDLCMNIKSNPTTAMANDLFEIARLDEILTTKSYHDFKNKFQNHLYSADTLAKINHYLYYYGDRTVMEIDIRTPRLRDQLRLFYQRIKFINIDNNQYLNAQIKKQKAYNQLVKLAKNIGKEKQFTKQFNIYEKVFGFREVPKYLTTILIGRLRTIVLAIGETFVQQGRLDQPEQIFDLHLSIIQLAQQNQQLNLKELIENNLRDYRKYQKIKYWPTIVDSRGKFIKRKNKYDHGQLKGTAISSGVVQGLAKVIEIPFEKEINSGEILVMRSAEPSCVGMFINASGIVLEVGSLLQHGAIIARELGIPCVSSIPEVTTIIKDGDLIEVDGTNGTIRIVQQRDDL